MMTLNVTELLVTQQENKPEMTQSHDVDRLRRGHNRYKEVYGCIYMYNIHVPTCEYQFHEKYLWHHPEHCNDTVVSRIVKDFET